jgi:hypothetical protein
MKHRRYSNKLWEADEWSAAYNPPVRTGAAIEKVDKYVDDNTSCATHAPPFRAYIRDFMT